MPLLCAWVQACYGGRGAGMSWYGRVTHDCDPTVYTPCPLYTLSIPGELRGGCTLVPMFHIKYLCPPVSLAQSDNKWTFLTSGAEPLRLCDHSSCMMYSGPSEKAIYSILGLCLHWQPTTDVSVIKSAPSDHLQGAAGSQNSFANHYALPKRYRFKKRQKKKQSQGHYLKS